jgi:DNA modification methylase
MVALQEGRNYVGIDLNPDYLNLAVNRVQERPAPQPDAPVEDGSTVFDLFGDAG